MGSEEWDKIERIKDKDQKRQKDNCYRGLRNTMKKSVKTGLIVQMDLLKPE